MDIEDQDTYGHLPPPLLENDELLALLAAQEKIAELGIYLGRNEGLDENVALLGDEALLFLNHFEYREEAVRRGLL